MAEYLLIVLVTFVIIYALIKGCNINININVNQSFSEEDRQLLEDLYNKDGDIKNVQQSASFDDIVASVNKFMIGEEDSNG